MNIIKILLIKTDDTYIQSEICAHLQSLYWYFYVHVFSVTYNLTWDTLSTTLKNQSGSTKLCSQYETSGDMVPVSVSECTYSTTKLWPTCQGILCHKQWDTCDKIQPWNCHYLIINLFLLNQMRDFNSIYKDLRILNND